MPLPRVLILFNEPTLPADHPDAESEHDILFTADNVARHLSEVGLPVTRLGVTSCAETLLSGLRDHHPDVVFNLYEGTAKWGNSEAYVCGILELLQIPFTGSPTQPLMIARSKPLTKQLLAGAGLPTAPFLSVDSLPVPPCTLPWPVIVKPGKEDASVGIEQSSVVTNQADLEERVAYILRQYGAPVLIEQFIRGREFNVALWARDGEPATLPFTEILFLEQDGDDPLWPIISFDAKWHPHSRDFQATPIKNPAEVAPDLEKTLADLTIRAFHLLGCRDYARVDLRLDQENRPYILEVNPNPCISPLAGLAAALESAKVPYHEFILSLVRAALLRGPRPELAACIDRALTHGHVVDEEATADAEAEEPPVRLVESASIRPARAMDAGNLFDVTMSCDAISAEGRAAVASRLRRRLARRNREGATILVIEDEGRLAGFAVTCPSDPGEGVHALEVLVIDPGSRRKGLGATLLTEAERKASLAGAKALQVNLSSASYAAGLRQFLARQGYHCIGELTDYYRDGTSQLAYMKLLSCAGLADHSQSLGDSSHAQG